jgi:hypothetical protein
LIFLWFVSFHQGKEMNIKNNFYGKNPSKTCQSSSKTFPFGWKKNKPQVGWQKIPTLILWQGFIKKFSSMRDEKNTLPSGTWKNIWDVRTNTSA